MLVNQTTYDSFGQVLNETNSLLGDRFKFTGRELNSGSDYYYRARQYSASSGRFGSLDPIVSEAWIRLGLVVLTQISLGT